MRLSAQPVAPADLSLSVREEMFALMDRHYENVQWPVFAADLAEKDTVILVTEAASGRLCGFSTQRLVSIPVADRMVTALFSGDTIIDRDHWGDQALAREWGRLALSLVETRPGEELYWFLISKGYKTYRYLPVFFHEFYPRCDIATPISVRDVIDALAHSRYPRDYDSESGVIRAAPHQYRLRAGVADIAPQRLADPHVRYFEKRNPDWRLGNELCCLAPLTRANFSRAGLRLTESTLAGVP